MNTVVPTSKYKQTTKLDRREIEHAINEHMEEEAEKRKAIPGSIMMITQAETTTA